MNAAILDLRPAAPGSILPRESQSDLVRLFALDRLPARPRLCCRWRRGSDGRLACFWEPDLAPASTRARVAARATFAQG
jgi:hypothetical protein